MSTVPLVGGSYALRFKSAETQRTINYMPVPIESGTGKAGNRGYLKQTAGLTSVGSVSGAVRGMFVTRGVLYVAAGTNLYQVSSSFVATSKGTLDPYTDPVCMADNNTQLAAVDGRNLYVLDLDAGTWTKNPTNYVSSDRIDTLDGFGILAEAGTSQFSISANQDFTTLDALDFASAEGSTGPLVSFIVKHRELILMKEKTGEAWYDSGASDFPLARNSTANIEIGCAATYSLCKKGGVAFWLGRDETGSAAVFQMQAYQPQKISTQALEELLEQVGDLSGASAFTYSQDGLSFYVLQVPGLETTWVFEMSSGVWHERAELVDGEYQPWRAKNYAYAYGKHLVGDDSGNLYELDVSANTNAGDALVRDRITPHNAVPSLSRVRFGGMQIDCEVGLGLAGGQAAKMLMRYSDDGGRTWGNWRELSLGTVGQYRARARASMLGASRDRVWHFRVTDDVHCDLLSAVLDEV